MRAKLLAALWERGVSAEQVDEQRVATKVRRRVAAESACMPWRQWAGLDR